MKTGLLSYAGIGVGIGVGAAVGTGLIRTAPPAPTPPPTAEVLAAERLVKAFDDLFQDETLLEDGRVGLTRMPPDIVGDHVLGQGLSRRKYPALASLKSVQTKLAAEGWRAEVGVLGLDRSEAHLEHPRSASGARTYDEDKVNTPVAFWGPAVGFEKWEQTELFPEFAYQSAVSQPLHEFSEQVIKEMGEGAKKPYVTAIGEWALIARAIPFRSTKCLKCHEGKKVGDTSAIMVVAVKRTSPEKMAMEKAAKG